MPNKLRMPSRHVPVPTPLFAMCWFGDPADGTSIVAACGGGGSAATGVKNLLWLQFGLRDDVDPITVDTGKKVGEAVTIAKNPITKQIRLFCSLGSTLQVYSLSPGQADLEQEIEIGDRVSALVANSMVDLLAVGCESGTIKVYKISKEDHQVEGLASYECEGHGAPVCSLAFAPRTNMLVSSAKDGTARLWQQNNCIAVLNCTVGNPAAAAGKADPRPANVRGCGFGDLDGKLVYTVASAKRGAAYLSKWGPKDGNNDYQCIERTPCSQHPASSMSISGDAATIVLGSADGNVTLWDTQKWKAIKVFPEVHELPVTCVAARPFDVPLQGEEQSLVKYNAISASADCQMGWLTLQRRNPKGAGRAGAGFPLAKYVNLLVKMTLLYWIFSPLVREAWETCGGEDMPGLGSKIQCIRDDILIAPISRPGIAVPPY
jgi:WD domain, G-beta repeat